MEAAHLSNVLAIARLGMVASTSGRLAGFGAALAPPPVARRVEGSVHRPARLQKLCAAGRPESLSRTANTRGRPAAQALDGPLLFAAEAEDEDSLDPAVDRLSREASGPTSRWFANSGKAHTYEVRRGLAAAPRRSAAWRAGASGPACALSRRHTR